MSGGNPVRRRIAWFALGVHLPVMAGLLALMYWVAGLRPWTTAIIVGAAIYLFWSGLSKTVALHHHRTGLRLVQAGRTVRSSSKSLYEELRAFEAIPVGRSVSSSCSWTRALWPTGKWPWLIRRTP